MEVISTHTDSDLTPRIMQGLTRNYPPHTPPSVVPVYTSTCTPLLANMRLGRIVVSVPENTDVSNTCTNSFFRTDEEDPMGDNSLDQQESCCLETSGVT